MDEQPGTLLNFLLTLRMVLYDKVKIHNKLNMKIN